MRLQCIDILCVLGIFFLAISQFTGFYYTFDESNLYHRSSGIFFCYLFPLGSLLLELSVTVQYAKKITKSIRLPLILFSIAPIIATVIQFFVYGLSLTNIAIVGTAIVIYISVIVDMNKKIEHGKQMELEFLKEEQKNMHIMFEQTAEALANAIDAKDKYTHGHSARVAEYSKQIATVAGKSSQECEEVYFAGLLHDVGKIGIPISIINKDGKLTPEEFAEIKKHPVIGGQILSSITKSPYLSIGAMYHHERYDGHGYPHALKGDDIPDIARMIAVADAYDAMTSKRSYRDPIPQQKVREEIVKGMDTQFDPRYAKIMLHLIDKDIEYKLKENDEVRELGGKNELVCENYRESFSEGIHLTRAITKIKIHSVSAETFISEKSIPTFILFDSLDANIHTEERKQKDLLYFEYGKIRMDGEYETTNIRKVQKDVTSLKTASKEELIETYKNGIDYEIEAVKYDDHIMLQITSEFQVVKFIFALIDSARYAYIGITGEHCTITNVDIKKDETKVNENYIPRIAEKISYIDVPAGDLPNIQIENWCADATEAIPLTDELDITFHTMSLPTARLVWHCPFICIFYSTDKVFRGKDYTEFAVLRLDGEYWESYDYVENKILINKTDDFSGWDDWKEQNKNGMDCKVHLKRKGNSVTMVTSNGGIEIRSTTTIKVDVPEILISITGDQCALTNIRINKSQSPKRA